MTPLFKKLNLKDQKEILVVDAPPSFNAELSALDGVKIYNDPQTIKQIPFLLAFVMDQAQVNDAADIISQRTEGDAVIWCAYPKASSKRYQCAFNRDSGWEALGREGFEPVRQVSIDEDWSALRFRRAKYIRNMVRDKNMALSDEGKRRTKKK